MYQRYGFLILLLGGLICFGCSRAETVDKLMAPMDVSEKVKRDNA